MKQDHAHATHRLLLATARLGTLLVLSGCASTPRPVTAPVPAPTTAVTTAPTAAVAPPATPAPTPVLTPALTPALTPVPTPNAAVVQVSRPLALERQWLQSWFSGTPVLIAQRSESTLNIEVPREFCFDSGRSAVKPALAAVLDKVAESLLRTPGARLQTVAAPGDAAAASPLGEQRAVQVRARLLSRGVPAAQLAEASAKAGAAVYLQMALAQP